MRERGSHGGSGWLCCVGCSTGCVLAAASVFQVVAGGCSDQRADYGSQRGENYQENKCWYELWYFWFIVALVFLTVSILILFFCKQQVKRSTGRQGRRCTPVLTMPVAPPQYDLPGHQPPPYHIAISSPPATCGVLPALQCPALQPYVLPPGCVGTEREQDPQCQDNMSVTSALSVGTLSNPPPYSPPSSAYRSYLCGNRLQSHQSGHR